MELLRAVLQPSINEEIRAVFGKYMKVRAAGQALPPPPVVAAEGAPSPGAGCREPALPGPAGPAL